MRSYKGFTLIEMMIVVTIIGILAAIAIPAYSSYVGRSQVMEGLALSKPVKDEIAARFAADGTWAKDLTALALDNAHPPSGIYVDSVTVDAGKILITFSPRANSNVRGKVLEITPGSTAEGGVLWQCGHAAQAASVAVSWAADSTAETTLDNTYLPSTCRG